MNELSRDDLLIELGCEELPPKTLDRLAAAFFNGVCARLEGAAIDFDRSASRALHSPRRLAMMLARVSARQPDRENERKGPALSAAFDADGKPTPAALGFARSVNRAVEELESLSTDKGEWLFCRIKETGQSLQELLFPLLQAALEELPVAKPMRWAGHEFSFVRPVHWLVVLHGDRVVEGSLYGQAAGRTSRGHRIHSPGPLTIARASDYVADLERACVVVDPDRRRDQIRQAVTAAATSLGGVARVTEGLLDEVKNLVEWPVAIDCSFDGAFLEVPAEALIASMEDHQKFFPVLHPEHSGLTPGFIAVANLDSKDPGAVRQGYERVIRPRLADAQFFWEQDKKRPLEASLPALDAVVFQKKIGSVGDKSRRIADVSEKIATLVSLDGSVAKRAALLAKCDLVSQMVGEFPELQGTMGAYYAQASGEPSQVARAIGEHYSPRFSGDALPASPIGKVVALADRLDTLVGIFAAGLKPTGNKDPFALRRSALGIVRLLTESSSGIDLEIDRVLALSANSLSGKLTVDPETLGEVRAFILDRARQHFRDQGIDTRLVHAALAAPLTTLLDLEARLTALAAFMTLDAAEALVAANKRIGNILRKADEQDLLGTINENSLILAEERLLFDEVTRLEDTLDPLFDRGDYTPALAQLADLQPSVDAFFDEVMVMDEDQQVRSNRLALLQRLKKLFDRVADLSLAG